jgi:formate/nitrite transporter FocA (FNT family)
MASVAGASPRRLARIAGALYLVNIVGGAFAIFIVPPC